MEIVRDLDITLLRTLIAVVEAGGMTRAANVQNLTQAAVSQQIKRLEELFGAPVFDRSQRQLHLTSLGERLLSHARRMVSLNDEIWSTMTAPTHEGEVKIGVPHDIYRPFLPPILRSFAQSMPKIELSFRSTTTTELHDELENGDVDLILTTEETPGGEMLIADKLVWAAAKCGQAYSQTPLPVALSHNRCAFRRVALESLAQMGIEWKLTCHLGSHDPIIAILEADMAVAPLLAKTVPDYLDIVSETKGLPTLPTIYINMYLKQGQNNPAVHELAQHIRNGFAGRLKAVA